MNINFKKTLTTTKGFCSTRKLSTTKNEQIILLNSYRSNGYITDKSQKSIVTRRDINYKTHNVLPKTSRGVSLSKDIRSKNPSIAYMKRDYIEEKEIKSIELVKKTFKIWLLFVKNRKIAWYYLNEELYDMKTQIDTLRKEKEYEIKTKKDLKNYYMLELKQRFSDTELLYKKKLSSVKVLNENKLSSRIGKSQLKKMILQNHKSKLIIAYRKWIFYSLHIKKRQNKLTLLARYAEKKLLKNAFSLFKKQDKKLYTKLPKTETKHTLKLKLISVELMCKISQNRLDAKIYTAFRTWKSYMKKIKKLQKILSKHTKIKIRSYFNKLKLHNNYYNQLKQSIHELKNKKHQKNTDSEKTIVQNKENIQLVDHKINALYDYIEKLTIDTNTKQPLKESIHYPLTNLFKSSLKSPQDTTFTEKRLFRESRRKNPSHEAFSFQNSLCSEEPSEIKHEIDDTLILKELESLKVGSIGPFFTESSLI